MLSLTRISVMLYALVTSCAPDEPQHPCDPESGLYNGCKKVAVGGECTIDPECEGDNALCAEGTCICIPACSGKECGDDECGGSCACQAGLHCGGDQQCFDPCAGKECGDGGYGESCGSCEAGEVCTDYYLCEYPETWTDPTSGHTWQVTPTGGTMAWSDAKSHCAGLSLDGSGWHLPNIGELRSLIRGCPATELGSEICKLEEGGCLDSTCNDGDLCEYCPGNDGPAGGCYWPDEMQGECFWSWSSSPVEDGDIGAWGVHFVNGSVHHYGVYSGGHVRCVRDAP